MAASAEAGHHANRVYTDHDGDFHLNGAKFLNSDENDIAAQLDVLDTLVAAELTFVDGAVEGAVTASKVVVANSAGAIVDADLILDSTNEINVQIGGVGLLALDDAAISGNAAATDTVGQDCYVETQDAGGTATTAKAGGLYNIKTGDGSASTGNFAGGAGGAFDLVSGGGGANSGGASGQAGGAGGALGITTGAGGTTDDTGSDNGGAGGAMTLTTGAGASSTAGTGDGGAGGAFTVAVGAGGATTAGASGAGGAFSATSGAGSTSALAFNGGVGGASSLVSGAGGSATGTGASGKSGGAGGALAITAGVGGLTDDDAAGEVGGAGGTVTITSGAGGLGSAGTSTGGAGGNVVLVASAGGTGNTAGVEGAVIARGIQFLKPNLNNTAGAAATLTGAQMLGGIIVGTPTADPSAYTTLTGAQITALFATQPLTGDSFELTIVNIAATNKVISLVAGGSGMTVTGEDLIENATDAGAGIPASGTFVFVNTDGGDTWVAYRK